MIERIIIENYQSIRHAELSLGQFTIISGPTNSGKSALVRAIQLWHENASGTSYITSGEDQCTVSVDDITVVRGKGTSEYRLPAGNFPKSGTKVPDEVKECMPYVEIVGQFDGPFLLTDSPGQAASALGQLTGVERLFTAARLAKRFAADAAKTLKLRTADLNEVKEQLRPLIDLPARIGAQEALEAELSHVEQLETMLARTEALRQRYEVAASVVERHVEVVEPAPMPLVEINSWAVAQDLHRQLDAAQAAVAVTSAALRDGQQLLDEVEKTWNELTTERLCERCPLLT